MSFEVYRTGKVFPLEEVEQLFICDLSVVSDVPTD